MPVIDGEFRQLEADDVVELLEAEFQREFGEDVDVTQNSVFSTVANTFASVVADDVEPELEDVYEAAFIESAEGKDLDKLVELVGISRQAERHATGVVEFRSDDAVTQDYTIQKGTIVQTSGDGAVAFETMFQTALDFLEGFEDNDFTPYSGTTASFDHVVTPVRTGNLSLKCDPTNNVGIYRTDLKIRRGDRVHFYNRLTNNAIARNLFLTTDLNNSFFVEVDEGTDTHKLGYYDGGVETTVISEIASNGIPRNVFWENRIKINYDGTITSTLISENDVVQSSITGDPSIDVPYEGGFGFQSGGANGNKYWDDVNISHRAINVRAIEGGPDSNVGANTIDTLTSVPSGVDSITNVIPTGDPERVDLNEDPLTVGSTGEDDEQLRTRVRKSVGQGGDATRDAVYDELSTVQDVTSITIYENEGDSSDADGRPPHSFEVVVLGGADDDIAQAIYNRNALTAHSVGGYAGTSATGTADSSVIDDSYTVEFSRPTVVDIDITLDIVTNENYIGDSKLRDRIVDYVGGVDSNGERVIGTEVAENVYINQIEDIIVGPGDTGVIGVNSSGTSYSPSVTTDANGLDVVAVGADEVAETDADDGSITINETRV